MAEQKKSTGKTVTFTDGPANVISVKVGERRYERGVPVEGVSAADAKRAQEVEGHTFEVK